MKRNSFLDSKILPPEEGFQTAGEIESQLFQVVSNPDKSLWWSDPYDSLYPKPVPNAPFKSRDEMIYSLKSAGAIESFWKSIQIPRDNNNFLNSGPKWWNDLLKNESQNDSRKVNGLFQRATKSKTQTTVTKEENESVKNNNSSVSLKNLIVSNVPGISNLAWWTNKAIKQMNESPGIGDFVVDINNENNKQLLVKWNNRNRSIYRIALSIPVENGAILCILVLTEDDWTTEIVKRVSEPSPSIIEWHPIKSNVLLIGQKGKSIWEWNINKDVIREYDENGNENGNENLLIKSKKKRKLDSATSSPILCISPFGRWIISSDCFSSGYNSNPKSNGLIVWDSISGEKTKVSFYSLTGAAFSSDGSHLATSFESSKFPFKTINLYSNNSINWNGLKFTHSIVYSSNGRWMAIASKTDSFFYVFRTDPEVFLHRIEDLSSYTVENIKVGGGTILSLAWDNSGERFAVLLSSGDIALYRIVQVGSRDSIDFHPLGWIKAPSSWSIPSSIEFHSIPNGCILTACYPKVLRMAMWPLLFK